MPWRPRPATELSSNQLPSSTPMVPRAVTMPTGTALIFLVINFGPLKVGVRGASAGAAACCVSEGAGAAVSIAPLLEPMSLLAGEEKLEPSLLELKLLPSPPEVAEGDAWSPPAAARVWPRGAARETGRAGVVGTGAPRGGAG